MKLAIIGAGGVGQALGAGWAAKGHLVTYGVRNPADEKYAGLSEQANAAVATPAEAAAGSDVVVIATPWEAAIKAVTSLGDITGKTVLDCTNPVGFDENGVFQIPVDGPSAGEMIAAAVPTAHVVKTMNQVGTDIMTSADGASVSPVMFVAGDDTDAKETALSLVADLGFEGRDAGLLRNARGLEGLATIWIDQAIRGPLGRNFSFMPMALE